MAVEYRFSNGNVNATLITDARTGARTFFVTEMQGVDPADIMAGIDTEIQEYHEADFIQIARDRNLHLDRVDDNGNTCLVVQAAAAGRFNGSTSVLKVADVTLASSNVPNFPIEIGVTWRMNENDLAALLGSCPPFYIVASDLSDMTRFEMSLIPGPQRGTVALFFRLDIGGRRALDMQWISQTDFTDMCMETLVRLFVDNQTRTAQLIINGEQEDFTTFPPVNFNQDDFDVAYGAQQTNQGGGISYQGVMRNLIITAGGTTLVNIVDPSTGTNTGTEADGTATAITSVGVIV